MFSTGRLSKSKLRSSTPTCGDRQTKTKKAGSRSVFGLGSRRKLKSAQHTGDLASVIVPNIVEADTSPVERDLHTASGAAQGDQVSATHKDDTAGNIGAAELPNASEEVLSPLDGPPPTTYGGGQEWVCIVEGYLLQMRLTRSGGVVWR